LARISLPLRSCKDCGGALASDESQSLRGPRSQVPTPVAEISPRERYSATVGVFYAPGGDEAERSVKASMLSTHRSVLSVSTPLREIILFQARPVLRLGPVEPYVAAGPALMFQRLTWSGSLFGIPGTIDERNDLTLGLGLAVGTDIRLARSFALGVRYRFLLAKNSFGPLSNDTASTTSRYLLASFAWYWPPDSAGQTPRPP